ncbi:hypothetical protein [Candidatus Synechococcus spongiarum]|uniref:hypothetical protein n=1 Tax=Candidatus Synechococcus spongiarum TaxID=431041 RepID=UPI0027D269A8|nr:hypothetical protein [Candidatus Synechococcus spongiarum]
MGELVSGLLLVAMLLGALVKLFPQGLEISLHEGPIHRDPAPLDAEAQAKNQDHQNQ